MNDKDVEEVKVKQLEKGVSVMTPPPNFYKYSHGDITTYNLREMSDEAIERYGLTKYKQRFDDYKPGVAPTKDEVRKKLWGRRI